MTYLIVIPSDQNHISCFPAHNFLKLKIVIVDYNSDAEKLLTISQR